MDPSLEHDLVNLDRVLQTTFEYASEWLAHLNEHRAAVPPVALDHAALPERGRGFAAALADFQVRWAPGFSGSAGPRYLGFVTGGATPAALAGDWLTGTFDQNPTSALDSSAPDLERETVGWLRELFGLSEAHHGAFVTGATMSNMVGLAIAREWAGEVKGVHIAEQGVAALGPVRVLSGAPHSSIHKGLAMLGLGRAALVNIPLQSGREAVDLAALERALQTDGEQPVIVVANAGTVNTVDFDDLSAIARLKQRYSFWLHVDGAFGSFAALSPQHAHWVAGLDAADSLCVDCHKWLNVPYDSAVQFTRRRDLQVRVFQNSAAYLGLPDTNPDFVHLTPENSRRLRALASWFSLAAYGRAGHRDIVERNVAGARALGELLALSTGFKLLAPVTLNVVCFTLIDAPTQDRVQEFLRQVAEDGVVFLTPTVLRGTWAIRAAFSNWRTTGDDVERVYHAIEAAYRNVSL